MSSPSLETYSIHGKLTDCGGNPVPNGYLKYDLPNSTWNKQFIFPAADGPFSITVTYCSPNPIIGNVTYKGYDIGNQKEGIEQTIAFAPDMDLGTLQICNAFSEFIQFTLDGTNYFIAPEANGGFDGPTYGNLNGNQANPSNPNQKDYFNMNWTGGATVGTYPILGIGFQNIYAADSLVQNNVQVQLQLNQVGAVGQPMIGTFGGTFIDYQGANHTITGDYKVNRDY